MPAQKRSSEAVSANTALEDDDPMLLDHCNNHEQHPQETGDAAADGTPSQLWFSVTNATQFFIIIIIIEVFLWVFTESDRSPSPCNEHKQE